MATIVESPLVRHWTTRGRALALDRAVVVAILNVTPDSFSDGGRFLSLEDARRRASEAFEEGADAIDIGGESTRPGARRIEASEELERVLPVLRVVRREHPASFISVDTTRRETARAVLAEGADAINDVSGLRLEPSLADEVAAAGAGLVLMHSRGSVEEMASFALANYGQLVADDVAAELGTAIARARNAGIADGAIVVDPGIGFAKRTEHSLAVLRDLSRITALGFPVMVGASRKRVIGEVTGEDDPAGRLAGTLGAHVAALARGARLFRVHDVRAHRQALDVAWRVLA